MAERRERFLFAGQGACPRRLVYTRSMRLALIATISLLLSGCTMWKAPKEATWKNTTSVEEMEKLYWRAIKEKDWQNVQSHTASMFSYSAGAAVANKEQRLEQLRALQLLEYSLGEFDVRDHGATTVVSYLATFRANGSALSQKARFMSVWQQQKDGYVLIASSQSNIQ